MPHGAREGRLLPPPTRSAEYVPVLAEDLGDAADGLFHVLAGVERRDADVALSALAEASAGGRNDIRFVEKLVEEVPAVALDVHPEIRRVGAADHVIAELEKRVLDDLGVLEVEVDNSLGLRLSLGRVDRFGTALRDVAAAVELGRLAARPEGAHLDGLAVCGVSREFFGDDRIAAADAGEAGGLRIAAELDRAVARAFAFID